MLIFKAAVIHNIPITCLLHYHNLKSLPNLFPRLFRGTTANLSVFFASGYKQRSPNDKNYKLTLQCTTKMPKSSPLSDFRDAIMVSKLNTNIIGKKNKTTNKTYQSI